MADLTREEMNMLRLIKYESERSFLFFCMYMFKEMNGIQYSTYKHLQLIAKKLEDVASGKTKRLIINIFPRSGKAIDVDTEIYTPRGFVKAKDILISDKFIGSDGKWTNINGIYPQGVTDLYRVKFHDNTYVDTCSEHLWGMNNIRTKEYCVVKTKDLINDITHESDNRGKWELPMLNNLVEGDEKEYLIDPYLLGCWIGDGSSYRAEITTMDDFIAKSFTDVYKKGIRTHQSSGKAETIGLIGDLYTNLKKLNLIKNKHVPKEYLYGSYNTRLAILQGLMDTDGTIGKNGEITFCQKNRQTVEDFKHLVVSLGGRYTAREKSGSIEIRFRLEQGVVPFRLERKICRMPEKHIYNKPRRILRSIEKLEDKETICFSVDSKDRLFAVGRDLILTHNTEQAVKLFIAWGLALNKRSKFIHLSYSSDLALDNSSEAKAYINSPAFQKIWKMNLKVDSQAKQKWFNLNNGGCYATSTGGQITGFGAGNTISRFRMKEENPFKAFNGAIIIDDPNKASDANSELERNRVNNAYMSTIRNRVNNPRETPIVVIQQRLHENDLSGFLLGGGSGEEWEHLNLPIIDENGESICPDKFTIEELMELEASDPHSFGGQYMQDPSSGAGGLWKSEWFEILNEKEVPNIENWQLYIDGAYTKNTKNDPTGLMLVAKYGNNLYIKSAVSKYLEMPELLKFINTYIHSNQVNVNAILIEPKASGLSMAQLLRNETNYNVIELRGKIIRESKVERASSKSTYIESGRVKLIEGSWNASYLQQIDKFPLGKHDEYVDLTSYAIDRELFTKSNTKIIW